MSDDAHAATGAKRRLLGCVVPLLVIGAGVAVAVVLVRTKPKSERLEAGAVATPVEVEPILAGPPRALLQAQGTVTAAKQIILQPEVSGRVVWQHPDLVAGGRLTQGQVIIRIDPRDYQAALAQQKAQLAGQQLALEQEKGRKHIAEKEWDLLGGTDAGTDQGKALALREPHLQSAQVNLIAAESALAQAGTNLSRTSITVPFNAIVQSESVDEGQLVTPQSPVATLVGTDAFWVQAAIPLDHLGWIELPKGDQPGSKARIWQTAGPQRVEREGHVVRLLADLDPVGRMARVVVELRDPLQDGKNGSRPSAPSEGEPASTSQLPLLLGAFVNVELQGAPLPNVLAVPRAALRENDTIFVVREDHLVVVTFDILWRTETMLYGHAPLEVGERVVTSPLKTPVEGMALQVVEKAARSEAGPTDTSTASQEAP